MYTYDYDFSFSPSMPVIGVALMTIERNRQPLHLTAVRVAADKHNKMPVLGRDSLNHLVVTLNGLASATELQE